MIESVSTTASPSAQFVFAVTLGLVTSGAMFAAGPVQFTGNGTELQAAIDALAPGSTLQCDRGKQLEITKAIHITKPLTLTGLNARLPEKLGSTQILIVQVEGVRLSDLELHGNYDSVSQDVRAPLIWIQKGSFQIEACRFYDSSKDGIMVTPTEGGGDIVEASIRNIQAWRMGRDVVSISGGNKGQRVRKITVENISLKRGYFRGAVEVSDGTDQVTVRNVRAEEAIYAIDVQDHGAGSAPNTNVVIENVEAVSCRHVIRTANHDLGHANLTLRNFTARNCELPVVISNTKNVRLENLTIVNEPPAKAPRIQLRNCHEVTLKDVTIAGLAPTVDPVLQTKSSEVEIQGMTRK